MLMLIFNLVVCGVVVIIFVFNRFFGFIRGFLGVFFVIVIVWLNLVVVLRL